VSAYRSTTLKLAASACNHALDHYEAGSPYDREPFAAGIAAHAVAQVAGETVRAGKELDLVAVGDAVVRELVTRGRSFDGVPEPPMSVDAAARGRQLAVDWLLFNPPSPTARYEAGLAVNRRWEPVAYDAPDAYYRAALDVLDIIEDTDEDGFGGIILSVEDYKSAPPTDADELDTVQIRGQLAVALAHHPEALIGRRGVVNLFKRRRFTADLTLDDEGRAQVDQWRRDIDHAIAAAEVRGPDGRRPANPGAGCVACPYVLRCEAARAMFRDTMAAKGAEVDRVTLATRYAVAKAMAEGLGKLTREAAREAPIEIPGGWVGYAPKTERSVRPGAHRILAREWFKVAEEAAVEWEAEHGQTLGLLAALDLGAGNVTDAIKALVPYSRAVKETYKADRERLEAALLEEVGTSKFDVHAGDLSASGR
jgi:hypothetical protein